MIYKLRADLLQRIGTFSERAELIKDYKKAIALAEADTEGGLHYQQQSVAPGCYLQSPLQQVVHTVGTHFNHYRVVTRPLLVWCCVGHTQNSLQVSCSAGMCAP